MAAKQRCSSSSAVAKRTPVPSVLGLPTFDQEETLLLSRCSCLSALKLQYSSFPPTAGTHLLAECALWWAGSEARRPQR